MCPCWRLLDFLLLSGDWEITGRLWQLFALKFLICGPLGLATMNKLFSTCLTHQKKDIVLLRLFVLETLPAAILY